MALALVDAFEFTPREKGEESLVGSSLGNELARARGGSRGWAGPKGATAEGPQRNVLTGGTRAIRLLPENLKACFHISFEQTYKFTFICLPC